jgi:ribosomal protein S18 acetylase RimI-like enzyme
MTGIREIDPDNTQDVSTITRLHLDLLGHGPMARLGELFLRRFCYTVLVRSGLMKAAIYEVGGQPAGFIAYTDKSITFHRRAIKKHVFRVIYLMALSIIREPRVILRLPKAIHLMFSRREELDLAEDPLAEVLAIGVLAEYSKPGFILKRGFRISEELFEHAVVYFREAGLDRMRMVVEKDNKPALLFYHSLGARFEQYEHAGDPMVHVWFDLKKPAFHLPLT